MGAMSDRPLPDTLLERLRGRIADPAGRVDQRPSQFEAGIASLDLGQLFGQLRQAQANLGRIVAANQAGIPDPDMTAKAEEIGVAMSTPIEAPLRSPATAEAIDRAEARLGFALPPAVRQIYGEVADGGFGPGTGLLSIDRVVDRYLGVQDEVPRNQRWPDRLLPLVDDQPTLECLDASSPSGRMITWDPEDLSERSNDRAWRGSFQPTAPSLEVWLDRWLSSRSPDEALQNLMQKAMVDSVRQSRAYFAAMTPEQRREHGLPEVGWERVIGGGLGLDEDD
jgi:SMI1 / KNR4 family (SUKH-1)